MKNTLLFLLFSTKMAFAQLPACHILLFETDKRGDGITIGQPQFATAWNRGGYNNQPFWLNENELLMTVGQLSDTTQTEIWQLNLATRQRSRVTATRESEYSPTAMPGGKQFSSVLIETDGQSTQRLWQFPLDRSAAGKPVFQKITGVGYHCWLRDTLVAMFLVGEPNRLVVAGLKGQKPQVLTTNPGRSLHKMADGRLAFIAKATESTWYIKAWNPKNQASEIICKTRPASEDFCLLPDGSFLMGEGPRLFHLRPGKETDWRPVADLSKYGVKTITRLAVNSAGRLAVVVQ